jgi:phosphoribosyl 1,2-cyclic phosphate phosphodiesterase
VLLRVVAVVQLERMELTFLGTGTSQGVPMIAHDPGEACDLRNPLNWRTRSSAHVTVGGMHLQIDAAPEFRLQCIKEKIEQVDCFILTHGHADHILGMDDLRRFIDLRGGEALPVYSNAAGLERVKAIYPYAIRPTPEFKGYPAFNLHEMPAELTLPWGTLYATPLPHGRMDVLGLVFEETATGKRLAYYTDCHELPAEAVALAQGVDLLVLDALRPTPHPTHMSLSEAIAAARRVGARKTFFTHMTFMLDHERDGATLPEGMEFAHDGLKVLVD